MQIKQSNNENKISMKKILFVLLAVCVASCASNEKRTENETRCYVPQSKYIDLEGLGELCNSDTLHYKSIIFAHPYCGGSKHKFKNYIVPTIAEMDTTSWKFYYIITAENDDTLDYNYFMGRCYEMGIDTNNAYIWRHGVYKEDYNKVLSLFKSTHPLENTMSGVPRNILLDKNNYIANQKVYDYDNRDTFWYEAREIHEGISTMEIIDFTVDDTSRHIMVRNSSNIPKTPHITIVNKE